MALQPGAELVQVVAPEGPAEGLGHGVVAVLEGGQAPADLVEVGEVVWVEDSASTILARSTMRGSAFPLRTRASRFCRSWSSGPTTNGLHSHAMRPPDNLSPTGVLRSHGCSSAEDHEVGGSWRSFSGPEAYGGGRSFQPNWARWSQPPVAL
jgi:hypothetical protein